MEHARIAYGLASAYAGQPLGPGPLDLRAVSLRSDPGAVLCSLVIEGCVGETLGVAEALALGDRATDPALVAVHARIAADEQRHAELSWRTLAWLLQGAGAELADLADRSFAAALTAMSIDPAPRAIVAPGHGVLASAEIGAIRRHALPRRGGALRRRPARPCTPRGTDGGSSGGALLTRSLVRSRRSPPPSP